MLETNEETPVTGISVTLGIFHEVGSLGQAEEGALSLTQLGGILPKDWSCLGRWRDFL